MKKLYYIASAVFLLLAIGQFLVGASPFSYVVQLLLAISFFLSASLESKKSKTE